MENEKVVHLEDRVPKLKEQRKQKANRRLIFYLSIFFLLILFIVYTQSSLSNVASVEVKGNQYVSDQTILKLSKLTKETSYWKIQKGEVADRIKANPEIKSVTIHKSLPNKVVLNVTEYKRIAYVLAKGKYLPINENGKVLKAVKGKPNLSNAPLLVDWKKPDVIQEMVQSLNKLPDTITKAIAEIYYTPERSDSLHITLYMNDGHEVSASLRDFSKKMLDYPTILNYMEKDYPNAKGIIHLEVSPYFEPYTKPKEKEGDEESETQG
ncbi:cell division protein FtsQ/DivIB [Priestia koreensis]|uniref:cell division protein FtsQ/DivIB n=1 Tax=Priestia koreensis TaxID=284581 RepID=UPI0034575F37